MVRGNGNGRAAQLLPDNGRLPHGECAVIRTPTFERCADDRTLDSKQYGACVRSLHAAEYAPRW
ncbi:MAG: hypothetical protein HY270_18980 [Deltaproteobacteria bacterium]|nr:hypothetical protein [Deltaproteobacteria bacterium]